MNLSRAGTSPARPPVPATAAVRVRAVLEARARLAQGGTWVPPDVLVVVTEGGRSFPLYVADVAALVGDPLPADAPMPRPDPDARSVDEVDADTAVRPYTPDDDPGRWTW